MRPADFLLPFSEMSKIYNNSRDFGLFRSLIEIDFAGDRAGTSKLREFKQSCHRGHEVISPKAC